MPPASSNGVHEVEMTSSAEASPDEGETVRESGTLYENDEETVPVCIDYDEETVGTGFSFKRLMMFSGPGLLMAIAYIDPGNLESDLQTGAQAGYRLGWVILWSTFLGFLVQLLAMRLGIVTHKHLAEHCRETYPLAPRVVLWLMTEVAIIGSDVQEVIGSAIAIQLLTNGAAPLWVGVLVTGVDTFFLLYLERFGVRKLEAFFGALVATMTVSFGVMYVRAGCDSSAVLLGTAVPRINTSQLNLAVGIVGALVMPHNIYLHSALVQSRKIDTSHAGAKREAILYNAIESGASLAVTVVINLFVMSVFAVGFHGSVDVDQVGLSTAGRFLGDKFGGVMKYIWAIGLFAAGQSSTMTGTYTGQFVMSGFMEMHMSPFKRALITRSVALLPTLAFAITYAGTNKMDALNQDLNVLQSFQLPFALIPVLYVSTRDDVMGSFVTRGVFKWVVQAVCGALLALNMLIAVLATRTTIASSFFGGAAIVLLLSLYFLFLVYLLVGPVTVQAAIDGARSPALRLALGWLARGSKASRDDADAGRYHAVARSRELAGSVGHGSVDAPLSPSAIVATRDGHSPVRPDLDEV